MSLYRRYRRPLLNALARTVPPLLIALLRTLQATLRIRFVGAEALHGRLRGGEQAIVAFWHSRQLMVPIVAGGAPICIMVSQHRDGEMATRTLRGWGVSTVRGSATRGGAWAFLRLVGAYRDGKSLALAPDGPRGPAGVVKQGIVRLGKATGAPIYPSAFSASRMLHLGSWDRMMIPLPFARVLIEIGTPVVVPADATPEQLEACRVELEGRLAAVTAAVDARVRGDGDRADASTAPAPRAPADAPAADLR